MRHTIRRLLRWEWAILLVLLPIFLFPQGYRSALLFLIPMLWGLRRWAEGHAFPPTPYNIAIAILLGMLCLSLLITFDLALSIPKISMLLVGIALFFATVHFSRENSVWPIVVAYIVIGSIMALVGLLGTNWESPFDALNRIRDVTGFFPQGTPGTLAGVINANELAGVLCWIAPFMLSCVIGVRKQIWQRNVAAYLALVIVTVACILLIVATSSRGGMFAFGVGAILVVAFFVSGRWRLVLAIGFLIAILILFSYSTGTNNQDIVGDTLGLSGRIEIWSRAMLALQDHPLTGLSMNGFRRAVHVLYPLFSISPDIDLGHAHNHLLQVAMDLGLPGLISYLALWIISVGILWTTARNLTGRGAHHHPYYALVAGLSGALLAGWLFGVFDAVALGSRPSFMWWLLLSMAASIHYVVVYSGIPLRSHRRPMPATQLNQESMKSRPDIMPMEVGEGVKLSCAFNIPDV